MIVAGHALAAPRVVERCRATLHSVSLLTLAASALLSIGCREAVAPIDRIAPPAADHLLTHADVDDLLSGLPPGAEADIRGLNNLGQATGAWSPGSGNQKSPYRWTPGSGFTTIAPLSANTAWGNDINDAGVVAGVGILDSVYGARAAVSVGSAMVSLGLLPGLQRFPNSEAVAINSAGEVVGFSSTVAGTTHAVLWDASRVIRDLGTLGGGHSGSIDINDFGQVIGWSEYDGKNQHPFLWTAGAGMRDLAPELGGTAILVAINGHGQIAGNHTLPNGEVHAFLFTPGTGLRDLGTLGGRSSSASGLNDQGFVVGASMTASSGQHAFLWTPDDGMEDITALAGVTVVRKLNDRLETITGDFYIGPPRIVRLSVMTRTSQTISFTTSPHGSGIVGETFFVAATATSGLPVTFGSISPNVCSVSGATVHFLALGECVVAADQGGDASFRPAPRATSSILVVWPFHGFANPIEDPPSFNELAAGHTATLRFSLEGDRGLHIFPAGSPSSIEVSCTTGAPIGHALAVPAGDFELRYQAGPDRYTLSWATSAGWAGSCRELALFLTDRSTHVARFAFR